MQQLHAHQLIPNLGTLDRLVSEATTDPMRMHAITRETEQLPYYLRGAAFALSQLEDGRVDAVKILDILPPGTASILTADALDRLAFALDSYLYYVRRTFDALISYLSRCPARLQLPASMNELVTKMKKGVDYKLDAEMATAILTYWDDVGARLKGYRDQTQHRAIILSTCIAIRTPDGTGLQMLLPDDHEETKPSQIGYRPGVPAMEFAMASFEKTLRFVNGLVERMIDLMAADDPTARKKGVMTLMFRGPDGVQIGGPIRAERVPAPLTVAELVERATKH